MLISRSWFSASIAVAFVASALNWSTPTNAQERSPSVSQPHLDAQLLSEQAEVAPGDSFWVATKLVPEAGWHTYWINPGDSGLATQINWQLPDGVEVGPIQWPIAEKYRIGPLANYGFEGDTYLLQQITLPDDFSADTLELANRVDWLVCEEYCIPGHAEFSINLPVGSSSTAQSNLDSFAAARNNLPEQHNWSAYYDVQGTTVTFIIEHPEAVEMAQDRQFYAYVGAGELVEHAEDAEVEVVDDSVIIRRARNAYYYGVEGEFPLLITSSDRAVELIAQEMNANTYGGAVTADSAAAGVSLAMVLLFAFLGGLILNLMPCVFPVLSLKALALASHPQHRVAESLWYTLGVVATFVGIAAILLALRASGAALGWGFQLQSPVLIALLALLFTAIALNLSGVYQMATSVVKLANIQPNAPTAGDSSASAKQSISTGVLAVIIASPCTAPFMGVALGFAIVQPAPVALAIFAVLGLGLAFPFLLLAFVPGLARCLPKPGAWMDTFKHWMAIPIYLTVVWLLWVFARQAGVDSQALLLVALIWLACALWVLGRRQLQSTKTIRSAVIAGVLFLLTAASTYTAVSMQQSPQAASSTAEYWQTWSPERLAEAKAEGPVFVNMTADWCITCLANERVALNTQSTRDLFAQHDITYLKGDWTLQDAQITDYLSQYERNGVPLYVLYWPGESPVVLPQVLTNTIVRDRIDALVSP